MSRSTASSASPRLEQFGAWLQREPRWVGGFDLPFGLPRELVEHLGWPREWRACIEHYAALPRAQVRDTFAAFCAARPAGGKFAHRACDRPAGSSPSMKWVNPPVAYMLHAGVPLLLAAQASLPAHAHVGDPQRVALEAYPGLLAREMVGPRSYKSDDRAKHTDDRLWARIAIVDALCEGRTRLRLGLALQRCAARHAARRCQRRRARCGAVPGAGGVGVDARRPWRAARRSIRSKAGSSVPEVDADAWFERRGWAPFDISARGVGGNGRRAQRAAARHHRQRQDVCGVDRRARPRCAAGQSPPPLGGGRSRWGSPRCGCVGQRTARSSG